MKDSLLLFVTRFSEKSVPTEKSETALSGRFVEKINCGSAC